MKRIIACLLTTLFYCSSCHGVDKPVNIKPIKVLLLTALPGSGKSEIRKFLSTLSDETCCTEFGLQSIIEIDDFPYVHLMRVISGELVKLNCQGAYFLSPACSFRDPIEWGTLIHLINEDYYDIMNRKRAQPKSAALWLFNRFDNARKKMGAQPILSKLSKKVRTQLAQIIEPEAQKLLKNRNAEISKAKDLQHATVIIEFARGGADSSPMPLPKPYGYQYAFSQLSPAILEQASILYVWVSPEESRRKNEARANPQDPGSILNHAVPRAVMFSEYGCDDIAWLVEKAQKPGRIDIVAHGKKYQLPIGRFDNRIDKTSFIRNDQKQWKKTETSSLFNGLKDAFEPLVTI